MKKQLMKVKKQFADQTFLRGDKLDSSNEDLDVAQKRVDAIKVSCQCVQKKIIGCLQGAGQDSMEKKKKKMPAFSVTSSLQESAAQFNHVSVLGSVLLNCAPVQNQLAEELLNLETEVEKNVISPFTNLLENDIPGVVKHKKQLIKLCQDMESAKSKYETAVRHAQQAVGPSLGSALTKASAFKDEYDELSMKVDLQKDTLAGETFALLSREPEFSHLLLQWYTLQADYHSRVSATLETEIPRLRSLISDSAQRPAFGCPLEEHLRVTNRQIALVIETCVCALLDIAMNEEGLFRIAGSATKVKRLKNAFDAGFLTMSYYRTDPHSIAGALKSYLRQLPEPLMTFALYDEWMKANSISDKDARLQSLWQVVKSLPEPNYNNLKYLIRFLAQLSTNSEKNKMSPQNIAIVIAPNLIWPPHQENNLHIGMNMSVANSHSSIVDSLVTYAEWFFDGEVDFYISTLPLLPLSSPDILISDVGIINSGFEATNGEAETESSITNSLNTSPTSHSPRVVHRPGKKPAPPAPGHRASVRNQTAQHLQSIDNQNYGDRNSFNQFGTLTQFVHNNSPGLERTTPPVMTRSATLDRPGKPKRSSLIQRQSHDNLAELVSGGGKQEICNYDHTAVTIRNRSLERPHRVDKLAPGFPINQDVCSGNSDVLKSHKRASSRGGSGEKPLIPAKPPSLDNLIGSLHSELTQQQSQLKRHNTESSDSGRSLSDKDSIQFVDDSDNDDCHDHHSDFLGNSSNKPLSAPLETSQGDENHIIVEAAVVPNQLHGIPQPNQSSGTPIKINTTIGNSGPTEPGLFCVLEPVNQNLSSMTCSLIGPTSQTPVLSSKPMSNFDKKWDFLTGGQRVARPPERPPRNFPLPSNSSTQHLKSEDGSILSGGSSSERSSPINRDTSVRSTRSASPAGFGLPLEAAAAYEQQVQQDNDLGNTDHFVGQQQITELEVISEVFPANVKVPLSPISSSNKMTRPPRPQPPPPPPPVKPKPNHSSEDTRL